MWPSKPRRTDVRPTTARFVQIRVIRDPQFSTLASPCTPANALVVTRALLSNKVSVTSLRQYPRTINLRGESCELSCTHARPGECSCWHFRWHSDGAGPQRRRRDVSGSDLSKWFSDYAGTTGVKINYQSIGSGGGIRQLTEGTVDFGASDAPMSDAEMAKLKAPVLAHPDGARRGRHHVQHSRHHASRSSSPARWSRTSSSARSRSGTTRGSRRSTRG